MAARVLTAGVRKRAVPAGAAGEQEPDGEYHCGETDSAGLAAHADHLEGYAAGCTT
jgi:hypothetical protein